MSLRFTVKMAVGQGVHAGNLVLGAILLMHVKDEVLEAGKIVDLIKFDVVGRLSRGTRYCGVGSAFEISSEDVKES
jgi:hypothetical protein